MQYSKNYLILLALDKGKCKHRLMETELFERHFNKDDFLRMTVSIAVQLSSSSIVTMLKKATHDTTIVPYICLKSSQYEKKIEFSEKG